MFSHRFRSRTSARLAVPLLALALGLAPSIWTDSSVTFAAEAGSLVEQASEKYRNRKVKDALDLLSKALTEDPGNVEALILQQDIMVAVDGAALVRKQAEAAAKEAPDDAVKAVLAARLLPPAECEKAFEGLVKKFAKSPWAHAGLGRALGRVDKFEAAEKAYRQAMSLAPDQLVFKEYLAYGQEAAGNFEGAAATWRSVLKDRPDDRSALLGLGDSLRRAGAMVDARDALERVVKAHPSDPEAHFRLALVKVDSGDLEGAIESAKRATAADGAMVPALCLAADAHLQLAQRQALEKGEPVTEETAADALKYAKLAVAADPEDVQAQFTAGAVNEELGESDLVFLETALGHYDKVLDLTPIPGPRRVRALVAKSFVMLRLAKWSAALDVAKQALDIDPENIPALLHAGHAQVADGKADAAIKGVYKTALKLTKNQDAEVQHAVGTAYWEDGKASTAKKYLAKAADLAPENGEYQLSYGELLFEIGEYEKAAKEPLFLATDLMPNNPQAWLSWARACAMETEFEESAIEGFEKYLELEKEAVDEHLYLAILYDRLEAESDEEYDANLLKAASHALRWKEKGGANPNWDSWVNELIEDSEGI